MSNYEAPCAVTASSLRQVVGALVFGCDSPLTVEAIRKCLRESPAEGEANAQPIAAATTRDIRDALADIQKDLERLGLGIELKEIGGCFRFQTQPGCSRWVRRLLKQERPNRLSRASLETLAIVAYRQPIVKSELEGIRGVTVDHIIKSLMEMHLIRIVGRSELPGRPFLYGTTASFLEHFGLKNLDELDDLDPTLQRNRAAPRKRQARAAGRAADNELPAGAAGEAAAAPAPAADRYAANEETTESHS